MRIMLDTNVLISALLFPSNKFDLLMHSIFDELRICLHAGAYPVLYSAIIEDVDVFITGDKDFSDIEIDHPEILTPTDYLTKYLGDSYPAATTE